MLRGKSGGIIQRDPVRIILNNSRAPFLSLYELVRLFVHLSVLLLQIKLFKTMHRGSLYSTDPLVSSGYSNFRSK